MVPGDRMNWRKCRLEIAFPPQSPIEYTAVKAGHVNDALGAKRFAGDWGKPI